MTVTHFKPVPFRPLLTLTTILTILLNTTGILAQEQETVDLQWALCDYDHQSVLHKLNYTATLDPYKANNITYYDTSPPTYHHTGLAFRTKVHHNTSISMVKARFDDETTNIPDAADCVWDRYGNRTFFTCSLASNLTLFPFASETHQHPRLDSLAPPQDQSIWSPAQMAFAERYQRVNWTALVSYGPYTNPKWKIQIAGFNATFDDVIATLGPTSNAPSTVLHLMEIEVKAGVDVASEVYRLITEVLEASRVRLCTPVQRSKTSRLFRALSRDGDGLGVDVGEAVAERNVQAVLKQSVRRARSERWRLYG